MLRRPAARFFHAAMLLGLLSMACASGPATFMGRPVTRPVALVLRVADAAAADDQGGTSALVETVTNGLEERGLATQLFLRDDDRPPSPRIEIWIEKFDPGDVQRRATSALAGALVHPLFLLRQIGAEGKYSLVCAIYREGENKPIHVKRHVGSIFSPSTESAINAGEAVGNAVLRAVSGEGVEKEHQWQ